MLWLGLGTETTWLGFREDYVFCRKVPLSVNTHMAEDVHRSAWIYWLAAQKYWHTVTPSPPPSPPDNSLVKHENANANVGMTGG